MHWSDPVSVEIVCLVFTGAVPLYIHWSDPQCIEIWLLLAGPRLRHMLPYVLDC